MIHYNCGGRGLSAGVGVQVKHLVTILQRCTILHNLEVELCDLSAKTFSREKNADIVLAPFFSLRNVKHSAWSGAIAEDLAIRLSSAVREKSPSQLEGRRVFDESLIS